MAARPFVMFSHQFFVGDTGQAILAAGGIEAAAIGAYLLSSASFIGIFRVHPHVVAFDLHISVEQVEAAFAVLEQVGFLKFDRPTGTMWIINGARRQLGTLKKGDTKTKMAAKDFATISKKSPLRREFHAKYAADLWLEPLEQEAAPPAPPEGSAVVADNAAPVVETVPAAVEAPTRVNASAPIANLTPPPPPVVTSEPVGTERAPKAQGSFPSRNGTDDDAVDTGIETSAGEPGRVNRANAMALSHYHDIKRMFMGLREQCRDQYPSSGDEAALALAERIRREKGPDRARASISMAMMQDDLDMKDARLMVFGEELSTADVDI